MEYDIYAIDVRFWGLWFLWNYDKSDGRFFILKFFLGYESVHYKIQGLHKYDRHSFGLVVL